ncbi:hypothetical protein NDU88_003446 [Pleurodeles waltl]|uniref:Uncharacterized protein n=1 Tax=Pleurodeles waltl TaxID=8319 RepID=A0AAV7NQX0_PLEWA|nr:hypothetical protein NDU88_003446 [Pleurodeles waltl]
MRTGSRGDPGTRRSRATSLQWCLQHCGSVRSPPQLPSIWVRRWVHQLTCFGHKSVVDAVLSASAATVPVQQQSVHPAWPAPHVPLA